MDGYLLSACPVLRGRSKIQNALWVVNCAESEMGDKSDSKSHARAFRGCLNQRLERVSKPSAHFNFVH